MKAVTVTKAKLKKLEAFALAKGNHDAREEGMCAMEMVAYLAGEPHSDHPKCACPVLTGFVIRLNDRWPEERRQQLKPFLPRLIGTRATREVEVKRAYVAADWAVRDLLPMLFEARDLGEWATKLRALSPIVDKASAETGRKLAREARDADAAAADDAYADAAAAADDAATYAATYAADAAAAAADDASRSLRSKLTVAQVDASALRCLERMIQARPSHSSGGGR